MTRLSIASLPELNASNAMVRIPAEMDVAITDRVRAIIDSRPFQRLKSISQLGLVSHVYPAAQHSRFEHSLGVYRLAYVVLNQLLHTQPEIVDSMTEQEGKIFLLAALLHDVGHWPYCHPIEDMQLPWVPRHEALARQLIGDSELSQIIGNQWKVQPDAVSDFLTQPATTAGGRMLQNVLNGPIDIDKMDYLQRDSLHAGVPYGRNFDVARLVNSMRVGQNLSSLAITEKGKTAAEMMVFARYVMFSEVYWHHAVRSATAMLQRLVFRLNTDSAVQRWLSMSDADFARDMLAAAGNSCLEPLAKGLFSSRCLYKRFAQYDYSENPHLHAALSRRPYVDLLRCSELLAQNLSRGLAQPLRADEIIIDAPPAKLEVQFNLPVLRRSAGDANQSTTSMLAEISPVVKTLATHQFDSFVKKVRIFVAPERKLELTIQPAQLSEILLECVRQLD